MTPITTTAERIRQAVFADSDFFPPLHELIEALRTDHAENGGVFPTDEECDTLAMGDDDGIVPENLTKLFPHTHAFLDSLF